MDTGFCAQCSVMVEHGAASEVRLLSFLPLLTRIMLTESIESYPSHIPRQSPEAVINVGNKEELLHIFYHHKNVIVLLDTYD